MWRSGFWVSGPLEGGLEGSKVEGGREASSEGVTIDQSRNHEGLRQMAVVLDSRVQAECGFGKKLGKFRVFPSVAPPSLCPVSLRRAPGSPASASQRAQLKHPRRPGARRGCPLPLNVTLGWRVPQSKVAVPLRWSPLHAPSPESCHCSFPLSPRTSGDNSTATTSAS